ncbi:baseplate J/gp47 family protein [Cohnella nanjingensis]|uniref:Baseplate J/gp47 family protein n=1 Tax=Cohnella nanjingensis TaxID=1387779 RepID=A0A7X0RVM4_9BACL|nr:baseplate J/gp47 family protein [Cohnella nanjingensis]MBB6674504.1 baseplate J/gp47 family protein [Cohnella nanjingensis]
MAGLPDYLAEQTEEAILQRMLGRIPSDVDRSEGSYIWDSLAPAAYELFLSAGWAKEVLRRGFASTTFGPYLDARCEEHGITRRPAVKATGQVKLLGAAGTDVPKGTRVATAADPVTSSPSVEFEVTGEQTLTLDSQGQGTANVAAVDAGTVGNVPAGAITLLVTSVPGITGVSNEAGMSGGADVESDESLLERYLLKVRSPGTSGNKSDYVQWALQVESVGGAQVQPLWNGPGTVKLFVLGSDKRAPNASIVTAVQNYIAPSAGQGEGKAPIGASVTVAAATEVPINVSALLTLKAGATVEEASTAIQFALRDYLKQLAFSDTAVRYSRIIGILLDVPSIVDFTDLKVNGGVGNVTMRLGEVGVVGTVNVSG